MMKKISLSIFLIFFAFQVNAAGSITVDNGGYRYKGDHWDRSSSTFRSLNSSTYRAYQIEQMKVRSAVSGATSAGSVEAKIARDVSKPKVMAAILEKARTGGKALGRFAVGNSPYGRAFTLALLALEGSKYFWSDEEGDFVKKRDGDLYWLFKSNEVNSLPSSMTKSQLNEWCEGTVTLSADYDRNKNGKVSRWCSDFSVVNAIKTDDLLAKCGVEDARLNNHRACLSGYKLTGFAVKIVRIADDYMPMTLDEFIDEAEPEADAEPNEWVNTSEVEPDGEPEATVKGGVVAQTNPYTDPKDGKVKQTKWEFEDKDGDGDADTVRETTIDRPDLPPNSPEAPELQPPTDSDTGDGTGTGDDTEDKDKPESASQPNFDLCKEYPDIMACDKQPEKPDEEEFPEIPTEEVDLKFKPDSVFPNAGTCPQPVSFTVFDGQYAFNTQPICDMAIKLRPFLIALAWLVAAFFIVRTVKSEI